MFKKVLAAVVAIIFAMSVVGCSGSNDSTDIKSPIAKDKLKIGVIYVGARDDGGWSTSHYEGIKSALEAQGMSYEKNVVAVESVPDDNDDCIAKIRSFIDKDKCQVIIGTSFGYGEKMLTLAKEYPNVKFLHCSGSNTAENMSNFFGRMYQARFLSGIAAGMKTQSNKIGYVAAQKIPEVIRGINAFALGVKAVNPTAVVEVLWTNTWYDPAIEKSTAETLITAGCDVIAQHQDSPAAQTAAEAAHVWGVGYDSDMSAAAPNASLTSPIWHWSKYYEEQFKAIIAGTWTGNESYWKGLEVGIVGLAPLTANVAEGTQAKIDEYSKKLLDGSFDVFANYEIKDQSGAVKVTPTTKLTDGEMLSMTWFVDNVEGKIE